MKRIKIVTVIGARPQFIKAAAVSREIKKHTDIKEIIIHTGQHFDSNMNEIFFEQLSIPFPDYNLNIHGLNHGAMTGRMLEETETILVKEKPDFVMVYGDTNSTIAAALAAKKLHIKLIHVEAGLRSFNMQMPEEINRILTDRISDILFCPTQKAVENLHNEGFKQIDCTLIKNGDVMQDAAIFYNKFAKKPEGFIPEKFVLATIHRAESTDTKENLSAIITTFEQIAKEQSIVIPLHPRTKKMMEKFNLNFQSKNIYSIEPVGYLQMVYLLQHCSLVMTDSGGLQKEAYFFKKNCITLRTETEWVELVENGYNQIVGFDIEKTLKAYESIKTKVNDFSTYLYGKGNASAIIVETIKKHSTL